MRPGGHERVFWPLAGLLVAAAWLTLWLFAASPYGRYLDHGSWLQPGATLAICRALPAGETLVPGLIYVAGWLLMSAAMMLPTTLPLMQIFRRMVINRRDRGRLIALVAIGYLVAWSGFGIAAHLVDALIHSLGATNPWLMLNGWMIGAAVLIGAGAFQFSNLKYHCLDQCRAPLGFVARHWCDHRPALSAFRLGLDHGVYCVGCCWALMLLMFVVGMGSIGWMLLLAAIMAAEKNLPHGRRLRAPLGLGLVASGGLVIAAETVL